MCFGGAFGAQQITSTLVVGLQQLTNTYGVQHSPTLMAYSSPPLLQYTTIAVHCYSKSLRQQITTTASRHCSKSPLQQITATALHHYSKSSLQHFTTAALHRRTSSAEVPASVAIHVDRGSCVMLRSRMPATKPPMNANGSCVSCGVVINKVCMVTKVYLDRDLCNALALLLCPGDDTTSTRPYSR